MRAKVIGRTPTLPTIFEETEDPQMLDVSLKLNRWKVQDCSQCSHKLKTVAFGIAWIMKEIFLGLVSDFEKARKGEVGG